MEALGCDFIIATPAFPDNKRTVFKGYLFAGEVLLNESGMQNHPLTLMTDANLARVLQAQTRRKVGLIDHVAVARGADAIGERIAQLRAEGVGIAIEEAGAMVEHTIAAIARGLVGLGVRQLVVAGGETSGACLQALGIAQMQIGPQIDTGVPWCHAPAEAAGAGLHIALNSGNFGTDDFFSKAFTVIG